MSKKIFEYGGYGVDVKIRSANQDGVVWDKGNSFVLARADDGYWENEAGEPVNIVSVNGIGEIRWTEHPWDYGSSFIASQLEVTARAK